MSFHVVPGGQGALVAFPRNEAPLQTVSVELRCSATMRTFKLFAEIFDARKQFQCPACQNFHSYDPKRGVHIGVVQLTMGIERVSGRRDVPLATQQRADRELRPLSREHSVRQEPAPLSRNNAIGSEELRRLRDGQ